MRTQTWLKKDFFALIVRILFFVSILLPRILYASFIEATMGTAVVNDATATYFNPAALTLVKKSQVIALGSIAEAKSTFSGIVLHRASGFQQRGSTSTKTPFVLPSFYLALPVFGKLTAGLAVITNFFNSDVEGRSLLRYNQASNSISDMDLVPALGLKLSSTFALGAGINHSFVRFIQKPVSGLPGFNIPDNESLNESFAHSFGGSVGLLWKPYQKILVGLHFRSKNTYPF